MYKTNSKEFVGVGQNEKITSGTKIYLGYMASVPTEKKKKLSHQINLRKNTRG